MRSVRASLGTPPSVSKWRTRPSKVCWRSTEVVNHQSRWRLQHATAPKHHSSSPRPQSRARFEQSDQSNCDSSPGAVSMGTLTCAARRNRGPRWRRTSRDTDG